VPFKEAEGVGGVDEGRAPFNHLKLTFVAERPPPHVAYQEILVAAETDAKYIS